MSNSICRSRYSIQINRCIIFINHFFYFSCIFVCIHQFSLFARLFLEIRFLVIASGSKFLSLSTIILPKMVILAECAIFLRYTNKQTNKPNRFSGELFDIIISSAIPSYLAMILFNYGINKIINVSTFLVRKCQFDFGMSRMKTSIYISS